MSRSIRVLYRGVKGRVRRNFNWPPITRESAVVVTAAEWAPAQGSVFGVSDGRPRLGAANVYVTNIGPHGPEPDVGGVEFHLHVEWDEPLDVAVTISVLDPVEDFVTG